ncbi:MAG: 30S ribosomal protein S21 [Bacteriovoracaceae bacterium]
MTKQTIAVKVDERLGVEKSLKKFKRLCETFGVVREYRKRQEYKKPSVRNKEKLAAADKRRKKTIVKNTRSARI